MQWQLEEKMVIQYKYMKHNHHRKEGCIVNNQKSEPKFDEDIKRRKKELREELVRRQRSLSGEYKKDASRKIAEKVFKNKDYLAANTIFIYSGTDNEVDTSIIISDALSRGKRVALPKTITLGNMEAWRIISMNDLEIGRYGIMEPKAGSEILKPDDIDIVFVPCLAFSKDGYRLGYGGGFYDIFLTKSNFRKIIIAFDKMMYEDIPADNHDQKVDGIITEEGYYI
jgi:5-formyltetrahydrofolate cyclo-ligase